MNSTGCLTSKHESYHNAIQANRDEANNIHWRFEPPNSNGRRPNNMNLLHLSYYHQMKRAKARSKRLHTKNSIDKEFRGRIKQNAKVNRGDANVIRVFKPNAENKNSTWRRCGYVRCSSSLGTHWTSWKARNHRTPRLQITVAMAWMWFHGTTGFHAALCARYNESAQLTLNKLDVLTQAPDDIVWRTEKVNHST